MKLLLFDIDGTLVRYRGAGRRASERTFERVFGIAGVAERTSGVSFAGSTDPRILREMAESLGIARAEFDARLAELRGAYLEEIRAEIGAYAADPVLPGVRALLDALAARDDARLGLLTGNYEHGARIKLEPIGLQRYFPAGGFGDDSEDRRVVAAVARARCAAHHRFDPPPDRVVVIGDTIHDVDCARANGFRAVAVCTGSMDRAALEATRPDALLDDLSGDAALRAIVA